MNTQHPDRRRLTTAWTDERRAATRALRRHDRTIAWAHLERAHLISTPTAVPADLRAMFASDFGGAP